MFQKKRLSVKRILFNTLLIHIVELHIAVVALNAQNLKQKNHVLDMSGGTANSSELILKYALGQPSAIGYSTDNSLKISLGFLAQSLGTITVVEHLQKIVPTKFYLKQNYPNPFNPSTTIEFGIAKAGLVKVRVWNVMGQLVALPIEKKYDPGTYQIIFNASNLVSGVYFYQIEAGSFVEIRKMILTK